MRFHWVWWVLLAGCQTYEFQRVEPFAIGQTTQRTLFASKRLKPNIMLLVDKSGSMLLPTDKADPRCALGCGNSASNPCAPMCPTRISELKSAMHEFLRDQGTIARLGLTTFPQTTDLQACQGSTNINAQLPAPTRNDEGTDATLQAAASALDVLVQDLKPQGGTPTAASLDFVGQTGSLTDLNDGRDDFVILLTDGVPNCADTNPVGICDCDGAGNCSAPRIAACACTQTSCSGAALCSRGCLDEGGAVASVKALRQKGIRTIVVGFGADFADGAGPMVLKAMADEGGFARACPNHTTTECGGGVCNVATGFCETSYFTARNGGELGSALAKISASFVVDACDFTLLARPTDGSLISVLVDGVNVARGPETWRYDEASNHLFFQGALCDRLKVSTPQDPVSLEFRIVEKL